jgi:phytoene dehydrogenase-like protein
MNNHANGNTIIIVGGGFAGLGAGIYSRMNGYETEIFEMHNLPGGLCTSWKRKEYTFDGCIHWLVGSSPESGMHDLWEETGIAQNRKFINSDQYLRYEGSDGRTIVFYCDIDRLEKHLLEFSPQDEEPIRDFIKGIRMCLPFDIPSKHDNVFKKLGKRIKTVSNFIINGKKMQEWMKITAEEFSDRIRDPLLKKALKEMWLPDFSIFFMLFTFAYLHNKNAGYPIGGSRPMSEALEARYKELGGTIHYKKKVIKILTENNKALGVRLEDGSEYKADRVISAADGYSTIFKMLDGKYLDQKTQEPFDKWPLFPSLIFVSLGINRNFEDVPKSVSGMIIELKEPVVIADKRRENLSIHIYNQDSTLAPAGKTSVEIMLDSDYDYWKTLATDRKAYDRQKEETGNKIVELLEQRFPGISSLVEVIDVATPLTFERYTGNWKGTFEGWLITPENSHVMMKPMSQTLPGIDRFYMCGQWVEPGGGLPTAIMSAKRLVKMICKEDRKKFITS